jgi:hypothetical protein
MDQSQVTPSRHLRWQIQTMQLKTATKWQSNPIGNEEAMSYPNASGNA